MPLICPAATGRIAFGAGMATLSPDVLVGHIHLKVSDLDRAIVFYRDVLGFDVVQKLGEHAAFLSAGAYHHHIERHLGVSGRPGAAARHHEARPHGVRVSDATDLAGRCAGWSTTTGL